jgi:hypothetical protein
VRAIEGGGQGWCGPLGLLRAGGVLDYREAEVETGWRAALIGAGQGGVNATEGACMQLFLLGTVVHALVSVLMRPPRSVAASWSRC